MARMVWVLGSGFSKALGGPLLNQLFSGGARREVQFAHPQLKGEVPEVFDTFNEGCKNQVWAHAEEFLEYVETAAQKVGSPRRQVLDSLGHSSAPTLCSKARRLMAAQCYFTRDADTSAEAWQPYLHWAKQLTKDDSIITFNYDLALEAMHSAGGSLELPALSKAGLANATKANVYKLHGSIDWVDGGGGTLTRLDPPTAAFLDNSDKLVLAAPGPTKTASVNGSLNWIWEAALDALGQADDVFFVGYRFPPSDSEARRRLLGALGADRESPPTVHIVSVITQIDGRKFKRTDGFAGKRKASALSAGPS